MQSRGYIFQPSNAYDVGYTGITPPSGSVMLWRPSQLGATENQSISLLTDEGSYGWNLTPGGSENPVYQTISGIPSLRYSGALGNLNTRMLSSTFADISLPVTTGLFIFNPTNNTAISNSYLGASGGTPGKRLGVSCFNSSNYVFGYRGGALLNPGIPKPAINTWHYIVVYFNGASSHINLNGNQFGTGNPGGETLINRYNIGAYDVGTENRFIGNIADVGFWTGDKRTEVEAYARAVLGLP
jgi:hypothetical protein